MSHNEATELRRRAHVLRTVALRVEQSPVMTLERHADDDTWRGRRPALCRSMLIANQAQLHREVEALRWQAYLLDQQALDLETQIALRPGA